MSRNPEVSYGIRRMPIEQIGRICEIDVSERGEVVYKWANGCVEATAQRWNRPRYDDAGWRERAEMVAAAIAQGGTALGAFHGQRLVGFAALRFRLTADVSQLVALWVSRRHRRQGIATALTTELIRLTKAEGARAVYVSATPSESAQGFYRSLGFRPTEFVHQALYDREPEDIHMILSLGEDRATFQPTRTPTGGLKEGGTP
jgi:ribosomal protein S18 acetylase RimI-like enzyme